MKTLLRTAICASLLLSTASMAAMMSQSTTMVGGAEMYPSKKHTQPVADADQCAEYRRRSQP